MDSARDFVRPRNVQQRSGRFFVRDGHDRGALPMNWYMLSFGLSLLRLNTGFHWRDPVRC